MQVLVADEFMMVRAGAATIVSLVAVPLLLPRFLARWVPEFNTRTMAVLTDEITGFVIDQAIGVTAVATWLTAVVGLTLLASWVATATASKR